MRDQETIPARDSGLLECNLLRGDVPLLLLFGRVVLRLLLTCLPAYGLRILIAHLQLPFSFRSAFAPKVVPRRPIGTGRERSIACDQLHAASGAEYNPLPSRRRVLFLAAPRHPDEVVEEVSTRRAVAYRNDDAPVIQVVTPVLPFPLRDHRDTSLCAFD
jgi:hypothetical protein